MEKTVKFVVEIGYKKFVFSEIDEAKLFAITAKKNAVEPEEVRIVIDLEEVQNDVGI